MKSVAKHLHESHLAAAQHCADCAKLHKSLSSRHAERATSTEVLNPSESKFHKAVSADHASMADVFTTMGEHHVASCKEITNAQKAMGGETEEAAPQLAKILGDVPA